MEQLLQLIGQVDNIALAVMVFLLWDMRKQIVKMTEDQNKLIETLIGLLREDTIKLVKRKSDGEY